MPVYSSTDKIKKRRGIYSERHLFPSQVEFTTNESYFSQTCIAHFDNLSSEKNIPITADTVFPKSATSIKVKNNPSLSVPDTIKYEKRISVTLIKDPIVQFDSSLEHRISGACTIKYKIIDNEPNERFIITEKLENEVIATKSNIVNGNTINDYSVALTDEQIAPLAIGTLYYVTIEISTESGGLVGSYSYSFNRVNAKPVVEVNSCDSTSAKFIVSDLDNNLSKIECYLDDVLKETITTDLYLEKTINYELTDNAIHTLKIVATDTENATAEKVLSISKEIMPLQTDATLQDISSKLIEVGEGFRNGKTSIINTLALKNIEASLNNTLVELSEKIKASFDSSNASVQELVNQLTEKNNIISQLNAKYKIAHGTTSIIQNSLWSAYLYDSNHNNNYERQPKAWIGVEGLNFVPNLFFAECEYKDSSSVYYKHFVFGTSGIPSISRETDFVVTSRFRKPYGDQNYSAFGQAYKSNKGSVWIENNTYVPAIIPDVDGVLYNWYAIKFI